MYGIFGRLVIIGNQKDMPWALGETRRLSADAPRFAVPGGNAQNCDCRYKHYNDRRTGAPRSRDRAGFPAATQARSAVAGSSVVVQRAFNSGMAARTGLHRSQQRQIRERGALPAEAAPEARSPHAPDLADDGRALNARDDLDGAAAAPTDGDVDFDLSAF
jgi:hypothetical protein